MAEVTNSNGAGSNKHKRRRNRQMPRVDMTPMVDLGFLLITFFMLSMEMHQNKCMEVDKRIPVIDMQPVPECCVLNVLIDSADRIYSYEGFDMQNIRQTSFSHVNGIEQAVIDKCKRVKKECGLTPDGKPRVLVCLIKLLPNTRYQNMVDIMDAVEHVKLSDNTIQYSLQEPLSDEIAALKAKENELLAKR